MPTRPVQPRRRPTASAAPLRGALLAAVLWLASATSAQTPPAEPARPARPEATPTTGPLHERQADIRARLERLENRMLELARVLAVSEPEKAERLRDALATAGRKQLKSRLADLVRLLREQQFGPADRGQQELLADLDGLLEFLTNTADELERMRKERERLDQLRRAVRRLMDEQLQNLYRTRQFNEEQERARPIEPTPAEPPNPRESAEPGERTEPAAGGSPGESAERQSERAEVLRGLEQLQRETQRRAAELEPQMTPPGEGRPPTPGAQSFEQARGSMQGAGDALGEQESESAEERQQQAVEQLQKALDELEQSLRQVRQDEREETLAQVETRLRKLLAQERSVREIAGPLAPRARDTWNRADELRLSEAAALHTQAIEEADQTRRMLVDEGTTVVVPALLENALADMRFVAKRFADADLSPPAVETLDDVIALLEEMLAAVEQQRDQMAEPPPGGQQAGGSQGESQPLLPRSAELKLLRSMQVQVNERTQAAAGADPPEAAGVLDRLAQRQRWLSERSRQMNEAP